MDIGLDDVGTSLPSILGCGGAVFASGNGVPMARYLAILLFTIISDPAQLAHVADRHAQVADHITAVKDKVQEAVDTHASEDHWTAEDKNMFVQEKVVPYNQALDQAAAVHKNISAALESLVTPYKWAGWLSFGLGAWMVAESILVDSTAMIPGVDVATAAQANASALAARMTAKSALSGLGSLVNSMFSLLQTAKGVLTLGGMGLAALEVPGVISLLGAANPGPMWPHNVNTSLPGGSGQNGNPDSQSTGGSHGTGQDGTSAPTDGSGTNYA